MTDRPCPLCAPAAPGADEPAASPPLTRLLWEVDGYRVVRCSRCGLGFVGNPPGPRALADLYDNTYFEGGDEGPAYAGYGDAEARKRAHFRTLLNEIDSLHRSARPGDMLEIGSAYGFFLDEARTRGWSTRGVEPSTHAAAEARRRFGLDILDSVDALSGLPTASVDAVVAWDVIEHVPEPRALVHEAARLLRPGGVLALSTGDLGSLSARVHGRDWSLMTPPWHLWYFTRPSMRTLLRLEGMEGVRLTGDGSVLVDPGAHRRHVPRWLEAALGGSLPARVFRRFGRGQIMYVFAHRARGEAR